MKKNTSIVLFMISFNRSVVAKNAHGFYTTSVVFSF